MNTEEKNIKLNHPWEDDSLVLGIIATVADCAEDIESFIQYNI